MALVVHTEGYERDECCDMDINLADDALEILGTPHPITTLLEHYAPSNPEAHVAYRGKRSGHAECVSDQEDRFLSLDIEVSIMPSQAYRSLAPSSLERTGPRVSKLCS